MHLFTYEGGFQTHEVFLWLGFCLHFWMASHLCQNQAQSICEIILANLLLTWTWNCSRYLKSHCLSWNNQFTNDWLTVNSANKEARSKLLEEETSPTSVWRLWYTAKVKLKKAVNKTDLFSLYLYWRSSMSFYELNTTGLYCLLIL